MDSRKAIVAFFLNKFRLILLEPGKRDYKTYLLLIFVLASHAVQICFGGLLVAKSDEFLIMAKGVKTIIVNFQVRETKIAHKHALHDLNFSRWVK